MGINSFQPGRSSIDAIASALGVVNSVYGIKANAAALERAEKEQLEREEQARRLKEGFINQEKLLDYGKDYNISDAPVPGALEFKVERGGQVQSKFFTPKSKVDDKNAPLTQSALADFVAKGGRVGQAGAPGSTTVLAYGADGKPQQIGLMPPPKTEARPFGPEKPEKSNGDQGKAAVFGRRAEQANSVFDQLKETGYDRSSVKQGLSTLLPNAWQGTELQQQTQAERNFLTAVLRRESGAVISPTEFDEGAKQYFPRAGDAPELLSQKAGNRAQAIAGLQAESGPAWSKTPAVDSGFIAAKKPSTQGTIPEAVAGGGQKAKRVGDTLYIRNPKTGKWDPQ